jgi:hypothetical protein
MHINCVAKHINKAGIRAEVNETPSPVVIFIARDHNYSSPLFSQIKEDEHITVRVIGQRFELNDKYISIIAELIESQHANVYKPNQSMFAVKNTYEPAANVVMPATNVVMPATNVVMPATNAPPPVKPKSKLGKITVPKKISIAKEISTELAKEIAAESEMNMGSIAAVDSVVVPPVKEKKNKLNIKSKSKL